MSENYCNRKPTTDRDSFAVTKVAGVYSTGRRNFFP
jgi:hypothetical protein